MSEEETDKKEEAVRAAVQDLIEKNPDLNEMKNTMLKEEVSITMTRVEWSMVLMLRAIASGPIVDYLEGKTETVRGLAVMGDTKDKDLRKRETEHVLSVAAIVCDKIDRVVQEPMREGPLAEFNAKIGQTINAAEAMASFETDEDIPQA